MKPLRLVLVLTAVVGTPLVGQRPISVTGVQSLAFGTLLPGIRTIVARTDAANSGQFTLTGPHDSQAQVTFTLPAESVPG